ncbi:MAG: PEP/pyruvate-binding domain-containing protein, partial [Candidatus Syntrophosphaera sp.]
MDKFESQALEDNLALTKVEDLVLPPDSQWLLDCSSEYYGIQQRTRKFLEELHHPYANLVDALELMRQSVLGDLWFYAKLEESEKAMKLIIGIFFAIAEKARDEITRQKVLTEYLGFIGALAGQENISRTVYKSAFDYLVEWQNNSPRLFLPLSGVCRKNLFKFSEKLDKPARIRELLKKVLGGSLQLWRDQAGIGAWFDKYSQFITLEKEKLESELGEDFFKEQLQKVAGAKKLPDLASVSSYDDIASRHRDMITQFPSLQGKIHYIFYLLSLPAMSSLSDHLLWDLNRLLSEIHKSLSTQEVNLLMGSVFDTLEGFRDVHSSIVLDCVLTIGKAVLDPGESELGKKCLRRIIDLGFIPPGEIRIDRDWQIISNKNHIKNIRVWLELIGIDPLFCKDLLAALSIALTQKGVFISDTDLFQKDVSTFLNSNIKPLYVQVKHLLRLFPVFYQEIGAEGDIRDLSTRIDEVGSRQDRLMHFVRKQVHTESNNTHIRLMKQILLFWTDLDLKHLQGLIPRDVEETLREPDSRLKGQNRAVNKFLEDNKLSVDSLLGKTWKAVSPLFGKKASQPGIYLERLELLCHIYYLLLDKYDLAAYDIVKFLTSYKWFNHREQIRLQQSLDRNDFDNSIRLMMDYIGKLNQVILDPRPTQPWENIYYKRHIAAGIPSMYGQYHEPKLEAMGMVFRLESMVQRLIERNIQQLNLDYITAKTLKRIIRILDIFEGGLKQEGITSAAFSSALDMLKAGQRITNLSLDQYLDLFKLVKDSITAIINESYYRFYEHELNHAPVPEGAGKNQSQAARQVFAEGFYRKLLSTTFLVQEMDNFIAQILLSLNAMKQLFASHEMGKVMSYDPDRLFIPLHTNNGRLDNQVLLGSKSYFLKKMCQYEFPIPPGFVITTELYRYRNIIRIHPEIGREMDALLKANLARMEDMTGLKYGDPERPLLLSVRSGAPMSLPGAMSTFLNIGMNDDITLRLSKMHNFGWTAWDCYRRLLQSWGMAYGIDRDEFDAIMISFKRRHKVKLKTEFPPRQMQDMCKAYKDLLDKHNVVFEQDVFFQIKQAIIHVLDSWNTDRARLYRQKLQIADDWGTAVTVQQMVLGNISLDSGSGVLFTYADWSGEAGIALNGDFTLCSQGEDVVAGLVYPLPVSEAERKIARHPAKTSLEKKFPAIYKKLLRLAR